MTFLFSNKRQFFNHKIEKAQKLFKNLIINNNIMNQQINSYQVVIIGAGCAGIAAATVLKKHSSPFIVLEARNRIGGRTITKQIDGVFVDLGASWIHNYGQDNPMAPYVSKYSILQATSLKPKRENQTIFIDGEKAEEFSESVLEAGDKTIKQLFQIIQKNRAQSKQDVSVLQRTQQFMKQTIFKLSPQQRRCAQVIINMNQCYQASQLNQLSALQFQNGIDEQSDFMPHNGYGSFIKQIANQSKIQFILNKVVKQIIYKQGTVKVICNDGTCYTAKAVISSLPLGVLKAEAVRFMPQLPIQYRQSINKLGFGLMNKVIVSFQERFWPSTEWFAIGSDEKLSKTQKQTKDSVQFSSYKMEADQLI